MLNKISVCIKDEEDILIDNESVKSIDGLAELIIKKYEKAVLLRIIKERFPYITAMQKNYILSHINNYNTDSEIGFVARKKLISECIERYLEEGRKQLYIDSFVFFRLKRYENLLEEMTERIFDDLLKEREYEEFIRLLRYFVNLNDERPEHVNILVRTEGVYELFDKKGKNITKKCLSEFLSGEKEISEVSFDDLLISMLITLAPMKITVHHAEKITNRELFLTINKVFDGNVAYCTGGCEFEC